MIDISNIRVGGRVGATVYRVYSVDSPSVSVSCVEKYSNKLSGTK